MVAVEDLGAAVREVSGRSAASVVAVGRHGRGSGFVVATNRVLTNAHNLRDRTTEIEFADGRTAQGEVVGSDVDGDLVVLDVETADAPALAWSEQPAAVGDVAVAVTAGRRQRRATWGQVTRADAAFRGPRGRRIHGAVEHTAPCAPGSSGAPVLDLAGNVVAVNTHRLEHGFYLGRAADGQLRDVVSAMVEGRTFERLTLGVALAPSDVAARLRRSVGLPERDGLLVRGVVDGSPAASAGVQEGDLLVRAGDRDLTKADDLFEVLAGTAQDGTLTVTLVRGTDEQTVTVRFTSTDTDKGMST